MAVEAMQRGYSVIIAWSEECSEDMRAHVPDVCKGIKYHAEVEEKSTIPQTAAAVKAAAGGMPIAACIVGAETGVTLADKLSLELGVRSNGIFPLGDRRNKAPPPYRADTRPLQPPPSPPRPHLPAERPAAGRQGDGPPRGAGGARHDLDRGEGLCRDRVYAGGGQAGRERWLRRRQALPHGGGGQGPLHAPHGVAAQVRGAGRGGALPRVPQGQGASPALSSRRGPPRPRPASHAHSAQEYVVDCVSRGGVHKVIMVWVYDKSCPRC